MNNLNLIFLINFILSIVIILLILKIKKNLILIYMLLEALIFYVNLNYLLTSILIDDISGLIMFIFIGAASGVELGLGLAFAVIIYSNKGILTLDNISNIKA